MTGELRRLEKKTRRVLYTCQTVFPFKLFPTKLELTPTRLVIKDYYLPFTYREIAVFLKDVAFVKLDESPFFASLSFEMMAMAEDPENISFLRPEDARLMEDLITGCIEAIKGNISPDNSLRPRRRLGRIGSTKSI